MKRIALIAATLAVLALAVSATALADNGDARLCAKNWQTVQNGTGGSFASLAECARSQDVWAPSLTISPSVVTAGQLFIVSGTGFHPSTTGTLYFAVTGQEPYFSTGVVTNTDGSVIVIFSQGFSGCGSAPPYDLTLTVTDSYGVHASAQMTLCL
jgi:hypothetical protein